MKNNLLFWQSHTDWLKILSSFQFGKFLIVFLNYFIWFFLFFISYLLVRSNINIFWQLLLATIIGELVEKYGKSHVVWRRPMFERKDKTPVGLVDKWYRTGSFPSGHTIKATFFFLFLLQYSVFSPAVYLVITLPLLVFRVLMGFHYPVDMFGGAIFGTFIWLVSHLLIAPQSISNLARVIFNFIFIIR